MSRYCKIFFPEIVFWWNCKHQRWSVKHEFKVFEVELLLESGNMPTKESGLAMKVKNDHQMELAALVDVQLK